MSKKRVRFADECGDMCTDIDIGTNLHECYIQDIEDNEVEKIIQSRKIKKNAKGEFIGFCDICEKLTSVKEDKEQQQFNICIDCEISELSFCADFLSIGENTNEIIELPSKNQDSISGSDKNLARCPGCVSPYESNQLGHMGKYGCVNRHKEDNIDQN